MKIKSLLILLFSAFLVLIACNKDDGGGNTFDAAAQALIDDEKLVEYLLSHHYVPPADEEVFGVIDTILAGETFTPLSTNVETLEINENDINYKLYYLVNDEGKNTAPTKADSVLVNYRGFLLDSVRFDERLNFTWLSLTNVIRGWQFGFELFKDGDQVIIPNEPIDFTNTGNGILFIPSGLAYGNLGTFGIGPNEPLIFFINLGLVEKADHDNDSILSIYEDVDEDDNVNNDDTDGDRVQNYLDIDDDGDGTLTRDELEQKIYIISFGEAEPSLANNEFEYDRIINNDEETITIYTSVIIDTDGDGTPDYLDPDTN